MAPGKQGAVAVDLNAMLTKDTDTSIDRQRRKNEALAAEVFGKGRRASAPGAGMISRKPAGNTVPSLASRIGTAKPSRSASTSLSSRIQKPSSRPVLKPMVSKPAGDVNAEWTHDLHNLNSPQDPAVPRGPRAARPQRGNRQQQLHRALNGSASSPALNSQFNIIGSSNPGISIRGVAGPYIIVAKNLAMGTTVADIEAAMLPIGGQAISCVLIAEKPKVIAEVEFETKEGADNVVDTLNNQNADGNILHVYHKIGATASRPAQNTTNVPLGPRADTARYPNEARPTAERYNPREVAKPRREEVIDGTYGFDAMDTDDNQSSGRLYSDSMVGGRGRDRGRGDNRGRGNNGGRGYNNR
ncbi:hypothetical protein HYFRA_00001334 [Hymenoscyphus fraxineus]|uniref:RRM domain-containing protein n=1 Tax=Hymenoscyphus fraxineus TaxID=746836 RepID=A0A9N9PTR5_9HELO|nr:hypothetical protein HYFRA_00001334 [Hymenoscyphus fraxineus]